MDDGLGRCVVVGLRYLEHVLIVDADTQLGELLDAAQQVLLEEGYSGLSTRRVAEAAGTQMSQIQYHFGSKEGMILALFEYLNDQLIDRQTKTLTQRVEVLCHITP